MPTAPHYTHDVVLALHDAGPTCPLPLANQALSISRAHGYALARRGEYPMRLLKLGSSYRVVTSELKALLGIDSRAA
ncbi:MAG: hypothetical protein M3Q27_15575 [Actinomycetota bacterium]|nr:hypothetical protein [Actinomycetota bacterium]